MIYYSSIAPASNLPLIQSDLAGSGRVGKLILQAAAPNLTPARRPGKDPSRTGTEDRGKNRETPSDVGARLRGYGKGKGLKLFGVEQIGHFSGFQCLIWRRLRVQKRTNPRNQRKNIVKNSIVNRQGVRLTVAAAVAE